MGIISVEQTDRLYWHGRYSERVYTTLRLYSESYDRLIDMESYDYAEFCRRLDIPDMYGSKEAFKEKYPNKNIWVWTGFLYDKDLKNKEVLNYIDVLVDGQYKDELHNPKLRWCGSSNQRVIDVKKSISENKIVIYEENLIGV